MGWLTIATSLVAVLAFTDSVFTRFVRSRSRRYAAEKEFEILRSEFNSLKSQLDKVESGVHGLERQVAVLDAIVRIQRGTVRDDGRDTVQ